MVVQSCRNRIIEQYYNHSTICRMRMRGVVVGSMFLLRVACACALAYVLMENLAIHRRFFQMFEEFCRHFDTFADNPRELKLDYRCSNQ